MAGIKLEIISDLTQFVAFRKIMDIFPEIRAEMLGFVGKRGKNLLYNNFFLGQYLNYKRKDMMDSLGRRTVSYTIAKRAAAVKIRSYPANFFEKGRMLRDGTFEPGRFIITRKFKSVMDSRLTSIVDEFDRMYLQRKFDKV